MGSKKKAKLIEAVDAGTTATMENQPRRKRSKTADADVQVESSAPAIEPEPPADLGPTLEDLAAGYLAHLEEEGKSQGTVFSYRLELAVAMAELGATALGGISLRDASRRSPRPKA